MKRCSKCGETKPVAAFGKDKSTKDGLALWCKDCKRSKDAACRAADPEKFKARDAAFRAAHLDEEKAYSAAYRAAHRDEVKARNTARYQNNREEILEKQRQPAFREKLNLERREATEMRKMEKHDTNKLEADWKTE
jgi:hypothetical protein